MIPIFIFCVTFALCVSTSLIFQHLETRKQTEHVRTKLQMVDEIIRIILLVQKHRGLGVLQGGDIGMHRDQITSEIDYHWRTREFLWRDLKDLYQQWNKIRFTPRNFDEHSMLIDHLIGYMEAQLDSLPEYMTSVVYPLAVDFRALEALARLRGLSVRASVAQRCPTEIELLLRNLCKQILGERIHFVNEEALKAFVSEITTHIPSNRRTSATPMHFFDMATPIINEAADKLRLEINKLRSKKAILSQQAQWMSQQNIVLTGCY